MLYEFISHRKGLYTYSTIPFSFTPHFKSVYNELMPVPRNLLPKHTGQFGYVKEPNVIDIAATRLFYYTPHFYNIAVKFCLKHRLTTLPSSDDHFMQYEFNPKAKTFKPVPIPKQQRISYDQLIFDFNLLEKFKKYSTLFVYNHNSLVGVLHYTDYNKMPVNIYLYAQIIELEYLLRALVKKFKLTVADLIKFWQEKAKESSFYQKRLNEFTELYKELKKQNKLPDLSWVYLTDLIDLINHAKILKISRNIQEIRNRVMHAKKNVDTALELSTAGLLHDLEEFINFFNNVLELKTLRHKIETLVGLAEPDEYIQGIKV